ncbi:MAG: HDIG domain-containing protein [Armatimonadetes bacterium]|nr:HDIG domain-containing protein [Armatimonadota bacterium]MDW8120854.1 HDIG domain-containing protein [Armatimonadota bacterium]
MKSNRSFEKRRLSVEKKIISSVQNLLKGNRDALLRWVLLLATAGVLFASLTPTTLLTPLSLVVGQRFPRDIYAHRQVRFVSESLTEAKRRDYEATVQKVYRRDRATEDYLKALVRDLFDEVLALQNQRSPLPEKVERLRQKVGLNISPTAVRYLLRSSPLSVRYSERIVLQALETEWARGLRPDGVEVADARRRVHHQLDRLPLSSSLRFALKGIISEVLLSNMVFDPEATQRARERARLSVPPVWVTLSVGQLVARKGDLVTPLHLEKLKALSVNWQTVIGLVILSLILSYGFGVFLKTAVPNVYENTSTLVLTALVWLPPLILLKIFRSLTGWEAALPLITTASMVGSVLISPLVSQFASGVSALAVIGSVAVEGSGPVTVAMRVFLVTAIAGVAAAFLSSDLRTRGQLLQAGFLVGFLTLLLQLAVGTITGETSYLNWETWSPILLWSAITATLSPALALAAIAVLERLMDVTSVFRLMELSSPHAPLLRELAEKAPGTFQSSLIVARLAQEAAKAIGANDLLTWTGALYHDIGKSIRPNYFVENQHSGMINPHNHMGSQMSAKVLALHVDQGVELARHHRLPRIIRDIIQQHHGNSLMTYFWQKALEENPRADPSAFRYKGPLPQTKEAALVMLADGVQAAVHSLSNPTNENIEKVVKEVVSDRINDGQLSESPLTLKDIEIIQKSFIETLKAIYHHRIDYPKGEVRDNGSPPLRHHNGDSGRPLPPASLPDRPSAPPPRKSP